MSVIEEGGTYYPFKTKQNKPFKVNDNGVERTIWESRSMAAAIFVFTKDKDGYWRVLANKRGKGCPDYVGCWGCPGGYLDYNETLRNAAYRECFEETGVRLFEQNIKHYKFTDAPTENLQNVAHIHYIVVDNGFDFVFSNKNNEADEVDEIAWIRLDLLNNFKWAFNHKNIIREVFDMRINLPWWKKQILKLYDKYLSPESAKIYCE